MKSHLLQLASISLLLASCENGTMVGGGDFDPLTPPGSGNRPALAQSGYRPGSFVRSVMDNTAFFDKRPKGDADADRLLPVNTEMKVISDDGSYVKVELNSGEVGFVPTVLVALPETLSQPGETPPPGTIPIQPGVSALPDSPTLPPVIDPDAAPSPDDAIPAPTGSPTPLPPGNEAEGSNP